MSEMNWMKAGRPRTKPAPVLVDIESQERYTPQELTLYNYGYIALALAIIRQAKEDNVDISKVDPIYTSIVDMYTEEFIQRATPEYSVGYNDMEDME